MSLLKKNKLQNISELAKEVGLIDNKTGKPSTHTIRFWEKKFKQIKPTILSGNRRFYSKNDANIIKLIIYLLKDKGLTIKGAISVMNNKINSLDDLKTSSIKTQHFRNTIILKSKNLLKKIKKIKKTDG